MIVMHRNFFAYLYRRTISQIHIIFNTNHSISDLNNIYKFHDILRKFTRLRECTDGRIDKKTDKSNVIF